MLHKIYFHESINNFFFYASKTFGKNIFKLKYK